MTRKTETTTTNKKLGIYFCGIVQERRKRMVPKENPQTEVVTYTFYDEENHVHYFIDDYAPDSYYDVGEYVEVMVRIKPYVHKGNNRPAYSMTIRKPFDRSQTSNGNGEVF